MSPETFRIIVTIGLALCFGALYNVARHLERIEQMMTDRWFPNSDEDPEVRGERLVREFEAQQKRQTR